MTILMNLTAYPFLVLWTILGIFISPAAFLVLKAVIRWHTERISRYFIWIYGRGCLLFFSIFVDFSRDGFDRASIQPPAVLVANHLSFFDTYCMALLPFSNLACAVRSWPFKMYWYTIFMRLAQYVDVERATWNEIVQAANRIFEKNGFLLFFPEGHRSRNGRLQRFHSGAFKLAMTAKVPVIPLCISGTDRLLPPGRWWFRPGRINLRALKPIRPEQFEAIGNHRQLSQYVKLQISNYREK